MNNDLDFNIARLGEPTLDSPLNLTDIDGDMIGNFVQENARVLYDPKMKNLRAAIAADTEPASFEEAGPRRKLFFQLGKVRAAIVTCGGLCPGINDVIRSLVMELWHHYDIHEILGLRYGYRGLTKEGIKESIALNPEIVHRIQNDGGSFLRSSRGNQDAAEMVDVLEEKGIDMLFTIGGDGTQRGALDITQEIQRRGKKIAVVGIPKTIDNDVAFTERTFGFETAFSIARDILLCGHTEARGAMNGIGLVKLMGRHSGYIAAKAAIATGEANFVLVPEVPFEMDGEKGFLAALEKRLLDRRHALVVVAEGAGQDLLEQQVNKLGKDKSGNAKLADIGLFMKARINQYFAEKQWDFTVKYIDPSYIIRSAPANAMDSVFCLELGQCAAHAAMSGRTGLLIGYCNRHYVHIPIAAAVSRRKLIDPDGPDWRAVVEATGQPAVMKND